MNKSFAKNKILRIFIWILTLMWMGGIFFLSSRPIDLSREDSAWFMEKIGLANSKEEGADTNNLQMMNLQTYIRKQAHLILFAGLAVLFFLSLYGYFGRSEKTALIAFILTTLYGATDEFHQIFSKRGAQVRDILVDARGAVWGLMFMLVIFIIIENSPKLQEILNKIYDIKPKLIKYKNK